MSEPLDRIAAGAPRSRKPPLHLWQPPLSGDIDIHIDRNGDWYHEGGRIERHALVQLFASILRREADGHYYLVTPVEKWRIRVDDAALLVIDVDRVQHGETLVIDCLLNTGEHVHLDHTHPLTVQFSTAVDEPRPYLQLDHGLTARLLRPVYYRLVDWGEAHGDEWLVSSAGHRFSLGSFI